MKKVLIISYIFPPSGGGGVQRVAKFANYLPSYNWMPIVLTVTPSSYALLDPSHESMPPNSVEVIRTTYFDPVARFTSSSQINDRESIKSEHSSLFAVRRSMLSYLRSLAIKVWALLDKYIFIPDQAVLWIPIALLAGLRSFNKKKYDIIFATGEPYSSFIIACLLSKVIKIPYVLDMRDPWTLSPYRREHRLNWRKSVEKWIEKKVLDGCKACVFANQSLTLYAENYPQWADKFYYLPNGFDSNDFKGVEPKKFDKYTFVHTGTFLPGYRTADMLLRALRALLDKEPSLTERIQVFLVGKIGEEQQLIADFKIGKVVKQTGYIPHHESIAYLKGANVLLLVGGEHKWEETGKIYEYLLSGKPILALVNLEGSAAKLLKEYPLAKVVDRKSVDQIIEAIDDILNDNIKTKQKIGFERWRGYDRKKLTGKLAEVLNSCI